MKLLKHIFKRDTMFAGSFREWVAMRAKSGNGLAIEYCRRKGIKI